MIKIADQEIPFSNNNNNNLDCSSVSSCIGSLITMLSQSKFNKWNQVIILIDEYDHPLNNFKINIDTRREIFESMKRFFEIIKAEDSLVAFAYVTGITSYGMAELFSGANNFDNLSFHADIHDLCGFTKEETAKFLSIGIKMIII